EPLHIARAFREKELPCDALIYLGTGYCTNGWNKGHRSLTFKTNAFGPESIRALHALNFKVVLHVNHAPQELVGTFTDLPRGLGKLRMKRQNDLWFSRTFRENNRSVHVRDYWARHRDTFAQGVDGWWPDDGDELPL